MKNGFTKIPNKILLSEKVNGKEKILLCILLMHKMNKKDCFPSRPLIAKETCLNIRTVDKTVKSLEVKGYIKVDRTSKVNKYKIYI